MVSHQEDGDLNVPEQAMSMSDAAIATATMTTTTKRESTETINATKIASRVYPNHGENTTSHQGEETPSATTTGASSVPPNVDDKEPEQMADKSSEKSLRKRHGARNQHKIKFFLRWLVATFPTAFESSRVQDSGAAYSHEPTHNDDEFYQHPLILDVAGGKGELTARMCFCHHQRVVLVDPRPADVEQCYETLVLRGLPKKWQSRLREKQATNPQLLLQTLQERFRQFTIYFDVQTVAQDPRLHAAIQHAELLVGMHADGATEAIVDIALQYKKPFVVIPCCVFPNLFHHRKIVKDDGVSYPVRSYEDFCDYLQQKDPRFKRSILPFEGRNVAIWWDGK